MTIPVWSVDCGKLLAKEVVFIDDRAEKIEAAKAVGLDAILFESEEQLRNELSKRGMLACYTQRGLFYAILLLKS